MFVVVTVDQTASDKNPFRKKKIYGETRIVNGTRVAYIHLKSNRRIKWKQISLMAGGLGKRLLLSEQLTLPNNVNLRCYKSKYFVELILMNTGIEILKKTHIPFYNMCIGIFDPSGTRAALAGIAVKHIPSVRIFTEHPERLEEFCKDMMDEFGAAVIITDEVSSLSNCCFIVAFEDIQKDKVSKKLPPILQSVESDEDKQSIIMKMDQVELPEFLEESCPDDINRLDFISALYEINRCPNLREIQAANLSIDGQIITREEASRIIYEEFII